MTHDPFPLAWQREELVFLMFQLQFRVVPFLVRDPPLIYLHPLFRAFSFVTLPFFASLFPRLLSRPIGLRMRNIKSNTMVFMSINAETKERVIVFAASCAGEKAILVGCFTTSNHPFPL